ncbi:SusF/SusE family outer membrane protein [Saprospiraceae bacterium]|nr:SusF/SusE family outer membrane protein [Saprospiraceae bacterium]
MNVRLLIFALLSILSFSIHSQSIGIIGDATPGGWDADTDMTQDATNPDVYTIEISLLNGAVKFRQDDDWAINWGSTDFPTGVGTLGGDNIPVFAGEYSVSLNIVTGEYTFSVASDIGIIGSSTPGQWDDDTDMYQDADNPDMYFITMDLLAGEAKFRQDNDWVINWGSTDFPTGTGTMGGDNIPVGQAGTYSITFNKSTGEYAFGEEITFVSVGIIGDATPGGWDTDTDLTQNGDDPNVWEGNLTLTDGGAKFRADDDWASSWGSADFPTGIGTGSGENIPVVAGDYKVSINTETGEYNFLEIVDYNTIGIIGDATPGGWDADTDMEKDATDGAMWTLRVILTDGELKFRADDDWTVNWGAGDFPMGTATIDGANIPIPAGEYLISFNTITGDYNFEEIVVYSTVGIIGTGSPTMGWDDDTDLVKNDADEYLFELTADLFDGEVKFRAEDDWTVNWGSVDFPTGTGTQDGDNIPVTAGTYAISLVTDTGEYAFASPDATLDFLNPKDVKLYPNPAQGVVRLEAFDQRLQGEVNITIVDITGQTLLQQKYNTQSSATINIASLQTGQYMVRIQNGKSLVGKKLTIVR